MRKSMALRDVTRAVSSQVGNVSGFPVVANEEVSLTTLAASRITRGTREKKDHDSSVE